MTNPIIHIDGSDLIAQLDEHGWIQNTWTDPDGRICAHQAIRLCSPQTGDAHLIKQIAERQGWGPDWNDDDATTESDVRARLASGVDITDADLAETYGPQWRAIVSLVRRSAVLTDEEAARLVSARDAAWYAASEAARIAASEAARYAARDAAWYAASEAARDAARDAAWCAASEAALAVVTWDLATLNGPYTIAQRDFLIAPWPEVCGLPEGLLDEVNPKKEEL